MIENFALSLVKESGILLVQDFVIKFINPTLQSYLSVTGDEKSYLNLNLSNTETTFESTVKECLESKSTIEKYFRHGKFNYLVTLYYYETGSCCCYFKIDTSGIFRGSITNEKPTVITPEFLLSALEQNLPMSTAIAEYFPEEDDLYIHFMTKKSRERYNLPPNYKGIFANKDLHLPKELPLFQFAPRFVEEPDVRTHITEIPVIVKEKKTQLRVTLNFVGLSARNNPVFTSIAEDVTAERVFEQQLDTKTQDLAKSLQTQNMLAHLCENIPILLGTVRVHMSEGKPRLEKLWYNAECDRNTEITIMMRDIDTMKWITRYLESKKRGMTIHWEDHVGKFGNQIHAWCSASHLPGTENDYMFIVQDISPTKQLEKQLVRSKSELENTVLARTRQLQDALEVQSRFLAVMSHEIRTPLSGILGNIHLLSETHLEDDQHDMLRTAKICGEQLLYLINDILDLTKMEENRLSLEMTPFTVDAVMEESIEIVAVNAEKKKLSLKCAPDTLMPKLLIGDAVRLRQVFVNLLSNSIKFSSKGEIIIKSKCLSIFETMATIQFSVSDQGEGIPDDVQKKIFQPFFQADSSTSRRYGGSGLGLNIAKRLTELMNGTIWFKSKIGQGTTFFFTVKLPIPGKFSEISNPVSTSQGLADLSINILVAEDNHINQRVIQRMLGGLGYTNVSVVENGELAVTEALNKRFHIVLMDCMMPIVSGFEATRMIRQRVAKENQPIIVALTADAFKENAQRCLDSGMDYVLYKPINKVQLSDALRRFCPLVISADCVNKS